MGITNSKLVDGNRSAPTMEHNNTNLSSRKNLEKKFKNIENSEQKFVLVWLDKNVNDSNSSYRKCFDRLQKISISTNSFVNSNECLDFLNRMKTVQILFVVNEVFLKELWPKIGSMTNIHSVYILSEDDENDDQQQEREKPIEEKDDKIKGIYKDIDGMIRSVKRDTRQYKQDILGMSIIQSMSYTKNDFKQLNQLFLYWFLVKQIILEQKFESDSHQELVEFCRNHYSKDSEQLQIIKEFEENYNDHSPVWWFTRECFLPVMINRALQTQDIEVIIKMSSFIQDLHRQLEQLQRKMSQTMSIPPIAYRTKTLTQEDFEKIQSSEGNLLSFNHFLLADRNDERCLSEARRTKKSSNIVSLLFRIESTFEENSSPFASLENLSFYPEQNEMILFSLHSIFRIGQIQQIEDRLWQIDLTLTEKNDRQILSLQQSIREETKQSTQWYQLAKLMVILRDFDHAKEIYYALLNLLSEKDFLKMAHIYNELGLISDELGQYHLALQFYQKSIEMRQKCLPPNHRSLGVAYNNIGEVQRELGEYFSALSSHQKTLSIKQKTLPPNDLSFATTYNNLGLANEALGDFNTALSFYQKALEIKRKVLTPTHIDLATTYNNIGELQREMGNYSAALTYFEKALNIRQKHRSPNDSSLAVTYNNIGLIHREMGDFPKAIAYFEKSLSVKNATYRENHPSLSITYNNIGDIQQQMGEFSNALISYEHALQIQTKAFSSHHPEIATTYNNIGVAHQSMGNYSKALSFYQKALKIRQETLSPNHPAIGTSMNNIGRLNQLLGDYTAALEYYQKTLKLQEKSLRANHPSIASTYNNIADIQRKLGDNKTALILYKKALDIKKKSLPPTHPTLATSYNNIGVMHQASGDYAAALEYYKKTLEIQQKTLPENHPDLAAIYNNIGVTHQSMKEYSTALEQYEKALALQEKNLRENHPDIAMSHNSIATAYVALGDLEKALFHEEKAVEIAKLTLATDHPNLQTFMNYLERIQARVENDRQNSRNNE